MVGSKNGETDAKSVILVAIDLSPVSQAVVNTASHIGGARASELHLLHVLRPPASEPVTTLHVATVVDQTRSQLEELCRGVPRSVERVVIHVRMGSDTDVQIAQLATDIAADLIVVGTHGYKGLDRILLGSVAESLVRNAPCPVLTYRPQSVRAWERIAPPCSDCVAVQAATGRATFWCERHSEHHPRAHTYSQVPSSFGIGAQTFR